MSPADFPSTKDSQEPRGDATREALIRAGLELFSKLGFHAASSRALAEAAGVNQALIGYHFGGKKGLYLAVFEHIGEAVGSRLGPAGEHVRRTLATAGDRPDRELLLQALLQLLDRAVDLFTSPQTEAWAMLIVREQQNPGEAFDLVWRRFMSPMVSTLTRLVAVLQGSSEDDPQVRLTTMTLIAQPLVFRVARETAVRLLGWEAIGPAEIAAIKKRIHHNVRAMTVGDTHP